jgi:hypothetical protein
VPYHWANAITGELQLGTWCTFVSYCASIYFCLSTTSGALLSYTTYDIIANALHRRPPTCTTRWMIVCWITSSIVGVGWATLMQWKNHIGSYRGLFCFMTSSAYADSGGVFAALVISSSMVITMYGYRTYRLVRDNSIHVVIPSEATVTHGPATIVNAATNAATSSPLIGSGVNHGEVIRTNSGAGVAVASTDVLHLAPNAPLSPEIGSSDSNQSSPPQLSRRLVPLESPHFQHLQSHQAGGVPQQTAASATSTSTAAASVPQTLHVGGVNDPWLVILHRTLLLLSVYFGTAFGEVILVPLNAAHIVFNPFLMPLPAIHSCGDDD